MSLSQHGNRKTCLLKACVAHWNYKLLKVELIILSVNSRVNSVSFFHSSKMLLPQRKDLALILSGHYIFNVVLSLLFLCTRGVRPICPYIFWYEEHECEIDSVSQSTPLHHRKSLHRLDCLIFCAWLLSTWN